MAKVIKTMQASILLRALGDKGFASVYEQYRDACHKQRIMHEPSQKDIRIASLLRKEKSAAVVSKMIGVSPSFVYGASARVYAYEGK